MSPIIAMRARSTLAWIVVCLAMGSVACGTPEPPHQEPAQPPAGAEPTADSLPAPSAADTPIQSATEPPAETGTPEFSSVPWDAARDRGAAWRGLGQEPGWTVEIHADSIIYVGDYGEHNVTAPAPQPERDGSRITWHATTASADLRVVFEELPCTDIMSGQEFPWTVTLTINGRELNGCGRRL